MSYNSAAPHPAGVSSGGRYPTFFTLENIDRCSVNSIACSLCLLQEDALRPSDPTSEPGLPSLVLGTWRTLMIILSQPVSRSQEERQPLISGFLQQKGGIDLKLDIFTPHSPADHLCRFAAAMGAPSGKLTLSGRGLELNRLELTLKTLAGEFCCQCVIVMLFEVFVGGWGGGCYLRFIPDRTTFISVLKGNTVSQ